MKKCIKCNKSFDDKFEFCTSCGGHLKQQQSFQIPSFIKSLPKQWVIARIACVVVIAIVAGYIINENKKFADARQAIEDYKIQKYIDEQISKVNTWDLKIGSSWTWEKDSNYIYIRGSVKNVGDKTIGYYKISADFLDSKGNVIDTDWTNSSDDLKPNSSRKFEMMHKYDSAFKDVKLSVSEVR